jgi:hypothetical protein
MTASVTIDSSSTGSTVISASSTLTAIRFITPPDSTLYYPGGAYLKLTDTSVTPPAVIYCADIATQSVPCWTDDIGAGNISFDKVYVDACPPGGSFILEYN